MTASRNINVDRAVIVDIRKQDLFRVKFTPYLVIVNTVSSGVLNHTSTWLVSRCTITISSLPSLFKSFAARNVTSVANPIVFDSNDAPSPLLIKTTRRCANLIVAQDVRKRVRVESHSVARDGVNGRDMEVTMPSVAASFCCPKAVKEHTAARKAIPAKFFRKETVEKKKSSLRRRRYPRRVYSSIVFERRRSRSSRRRMASAYRRCSLSFSGRRRGEATGAPLSSIETNVR